MIAQQAAPEIQPNESWYRLKVSSEGRRLDRRKCRERTRRMMRGKAVTDDHIVAYLARRYVTRSHFL